jgi:hypothetical protein
MARSRLLSLVLGVCTIACASSSRYVGTGDYVITPDSLRHRLEDFSDDSMLGRHFLGVGHDRATAYLAGEAARVGLEPAGENGGWFQTLHMYSRRLSPQSRIVVGDSTLVPVHDFKMFSFGRGQPRDIAGAQVVYGGIVGDTTTQISADAAASHVVLLGVPIDMTPERVYQDVGYGPRSRFGRAASVAIASLDYLPLPQRAITPVIDPLDPTASRADAQPSTLLVTRGAASMMLGHTMDGAVAGTLGRVLDAHLSVDERDIPTRNVIALLRGSDDALATTYVALGAHSDHFGVSAAPFDHDSVRAAALAQHRWGENVSASRIRTLRDSLMGTHHPRPDSIFNGADDDGSGSVALLEIARALSSGPRPRRSVLFVWHAAEENGFLGSRWFVEHPTVPLDSIVAQINLDMIGRGSSLDIKGGGPRFLEVIGSTRRSAELWPVIDAVNASAGSPFVIDTADTEGVYCRSDHRNYARFGIPIAFLTTGSHIDYHAVSDEAAYVDYAKLTAVSRFTADVVRALANRPIRLLLNGPTPDPRSLCHG